MKKRRFIIGLVLICVTVVLFIAAPYIYLNTENRNFEKLRKKSELNCVTMPLHCLVREDRVDEIRDYSSSGNNLELKDNWGKTALFWSVDKNKHDISNILLELGANPNTKDERGMSVLQRVVVAGNYDLADRLIASGADIDIFNDNNNPSTTLHYCVMKNNSGCVEYLVSSGANMHLQDSFGYTVFDRIRVHDHIGEEVVELLNK